VSEVGPGGGERGGRGHREVGEDEQRVGGAGPDGGGAPVRWLRPRADPPLLSSGADGGGRRRRQGRREEAAAREAGGGGCIHGAREEEEVVTCGDEEEEEIRMTCGTY
jgi:hypothetical protein